MNEAQQPLQFVEPDELGRWLRSENCEGILVVDVRDDDFVGGNIRGALNIPVDSFASDYEVDDIIDKFEMGSLSRVVMHCMYSQERGPFAARRLASRLEAQQLDGPQVLVLRGGFRRFSALFRGSVDLIEAPIQLRAPDVEVPAASVGQTPI